ncbi:hypothetical protein ONS95_007487 [Cadophora gregata]|uniref:uncharacterized protein n=1 Tax=Cadophora gregata TaxID=51156 RepID=UPI0026DC4D42|nr:uncharacterized protein ONS95_007487 [Cadophora gregata]KAK0118602.1 hypothetical protein ONS96_011693 [Cadophora gregata f. sp. sojae]KAK0125856.1 hypothetical protein ONS95_007487 [Cadophora gregata]
MAITLYSITIPIFLKNLRTLQKLLAKGTAHAKDGGNELTEEKLVGSRLIADMGDLVYQIQRISDTSKGFCVRVAKIEAVALEDNEKTMEDLQTRIAKTIEILEGVKEEDINGKEEEEVILKTRTAELKFTGFSYATQFALPNFFFHFVTAYGLLRKEGVEIGKSDYMGRG